MKNNILLVLLFFLISIIKKGQTQEAITSDGKKVILNADGTWKYAEIDRIASEAAERKRIETEQKLKSNIINGTRDAPANSNNSGTNSISEGEAGRLGVQGSVSYNLGGRGFLSLPKPDYDYQGEGRVVVDVSVDRLGKVTQATPGVKGSTTLNEYLLKVAKEAALKARFDQKSDAQWIQKGTITYNFTLR